jgi:hypothetical protein
MELLSFNADDQSITQSETIKNGQNKGDENQDRVL